MEGGEGRYIDKSLNQKADDNGCISAFLYLHISPTGSNTHSQVKSHRLCKLIK